MQHVCNPEVHYFYNICCCQLKGRRRPTGNVVPVVQAEKNDRISRHFKDDGEKPAHTDTDAESPDAAADRMVLTHHGAAEKTRCQRLRANCAALPEAEAAAPRRSAGAAGDVIIV